MECFHYKLMRAQASGVGKLDVEDEKTRLVLAIKERCIKAANNKLTYVSIPKSVWGKGFYLEEVMFFIRRYKAFKYMEVFVSSSGKEIEFHWGD